ncbi:NAD(P)/FAD-dependent oxidoreductase [Ideonella sp. B508-1]|uniref:NAD(P)/FAD-dependent oxidoreductase n=1 Tax=Ideonella sp. B508-1 TaxID=137716 RepID=UPI000477CC83|nr:FAD-dependent oxidoreductase [Ideonella sp. B508-1]
MSSSHVLVVVGAGHAGAELAVQAREAGWDGRIVLVGEEPALPYHRPPLSKAYLAGVATEDALLLRAAAAYEKAAVELMPGRRVAAIDRAGKRVRFEAGGSLAYSRLALATGGRARPLPAAEDAVLGAGNFHYLRTKMDVDRIRAGLHEGARLVIVGGGYVGLEVAASAVKKGLRVTVLEAAPRVLARVTEPRVSSFYEQVHRAAGVDIRVGVQVSGFELDASGQRVTAVLCADGERVAADLVVAGVGLLPNTELAAEAGLEVDDGILIREGARTSDPDIVAAGDCTRFYSALYGRWLRLESVPNALEQARSAAASVVGKDRSYDAVPWFWSDQYDLKLKMVGLSQGHDRFVLRGDPQQQSFSAFYLQGNRVLAVDTVNRAPEFMLAKRLVAERVAVDAAALADDKVPLKTLLPAA